MTWAEDDPAGGPLVCRHCGAPARYAGGRGLPASMRKAVHEDGRETGADGHLAAPINPAMVSASRAARPAT